MPRPDEIRFRDMLDAARRGIRHVHGMAMSDFFTEEKTIDAVRTCIAVIGEAASQVSQETRDLYPHLPWQEMRGMRNLIIHAYHTINLKILWDTTADSLPALVQQLETILDGEQSTNED